MKFLCLAYGTETDWVTLPEHEQKVLLAQDEAIRSRGALMAAVAPTVSTVRAWNGAPEVDAEGVLPDGEDEALDQLDASVDTLRRRRDINVLLYDFVLKRNLKKDGQGFAKAVFETAPFFSRPA